MNLRAPKPHFMGARAVIVTFTLVLIPGGVWSLCKVERPRTTKAVVRASLLPLEVTIED